METRSNESWFFSAIADKAKSLTSVKGLSKFFLLTFTLSALFLQNISSVNAQGGIGSPDTSTPLFRQCSVITDQLDNVFNDDENDQLIFTAIKDITVFNGKDMPKGVKVVMFNKTTKDTVIPTALFNAKHVTLYEGKLFYIIDSVYVYVYDLKTREVEKLVHANDRIINFYNMSNNRILVNALSGGASNVPYALATVSRLAIYNYLDSTVTNITDNPNIFQAFTVGEKIVYSESGAWFKAPGVSFQVSVYDLKTNLVYSRSDFNILGLSIKASDSTFLIGFNPVDGGLDRLAVVNVNKDLHDATFDKDDMFEIGGLTAPPIAGGNPDPKSPILHFINNEKIADGAWWKTNLKNGKTNQRSDGDVWAMNLATFNETQIGRFHDDVSKRKIYGGYVIDDRFVSCGSGWFYTSKLYGKSTDIVKNVMIPGVSVYPNPASGVTNINVPNDASVEVYSAQGQLTFSQRVFDNAQVPVNIGINIVKITLDNLTQTFKVIGY